VVVHQVAQGSTTLGNIHAGLTMDVGKMNIGAVLQQQLGHPAFVIVGVIVAARVLTNTQNAMKGRAADGVLQVHISTVIQ
jgi:hypothetical protein